jgi:hypothetical protein
MRCYGKTLPLGDYCVLILTGLLGLPLFEVGLTPSFLQKVIATTPVGRWMMTEERIARLRTHKNNIDRYRRLLKTKLSEIERQYLEKRLSEEQAAMEIHLRG